MELTQHDGATFEKVTFTGNDIKGHEFLSCVFKSCDFTGVDCTFTNFHRCKFAACNLSMIQLKNATMNAAAFKGCKLMGVDFSECKDLLFSVAFDSCILDYASFTGKKMPKTKFIDCSLKEASFSLCTLTDAVFEQAELWGAIFNQTNLGGANFATARNYTIDPELNNIKKASFAADGLPGLLTKYNIKIV